MPRRSAADAAQTKSALVSAARACFVTDGYAATTTTAIAARAGCSQSALFHHFGDKAELLEYVVAAELKTYDKLVGRAAAAATGGLIDQVLAGCRRSLELASDPAWSRLVAVEAPAVLGADRLHRMDADLGLKSTTFAIKMLIGGAVLAPDTDIDALALVLYGALTSAAFEFARTGGIDSSGEGQRGSDEPSGRPDVDRVMAVIKRLLLAHA